MFKNAKRQFELQIDVVKCTHSNILFAYLKDYPYICTFYYHIIIQTVFAMLTRRNFIQRSLTTGAGLLLAPTIVPASVLGSNAPSNRINIGAIGTGRISREHDLPGVRRYDDVRIVAVCDLDANRVADAKQLVEDFYTKKQGSPYTGVKTCEHYEELNDDEANAMLARPHRPPYQF